MRRQRRAVLWRIVTRPRDRDGRFVVGRRGRRRRGRRLDERHGHALRERTVAAARADSDADVDPRGDRSGWSDEGRIGVLAAVTTRHAGVCTSAGICDAAVSSSSTCAIAPWSSPLPSGASTSSADSSSSAVLFGSRGALTATLPTLVPCFSRSSSRTLADPVNAYTSTRSTLAGLLLSVFVAGTVNWTLTSSPRRSAMRLAGAAGSLTSGGSGGPFLPQPRRDTARARSAEQDVALDLTGCSATGLRS